MKYTKKIVIKNSIGELMFDFDYFVKKEFSIAFYKDGVVTSYLSLDRDVTFNFKIIYKTEDLTLIAFFIE